MQAVDKQHSVNNQEAFSRENANCEISNEQHSQFVQNIKQHHKRLKWIAAYIDGQYYMTDQNSVNKLKKLEEEIEMQKLRLANLENQSMSSHKSFLSAQQNQFDRPSNGHQSFCRTQFNQDKHYHKKQNAKNQLENEEEKYHKKIKQLKMQRKIQTRKKVKKPEKQQQQVKQNDQTPQSQSKRSQKKNQVKEIEFQSKVSQKNKSCRQQSVKAQSVHSSKNRQKSYTKSKIQRSIKQGISFKEENDQECLKIDKSIKSRRQSKAESHIIQGENREDRKTICKRQDQKHQQSEHKKSDYVVKVSKVQSHESHNQKKSARNEDIHDKQEKKSKQSQLHSNKQEVKSGKDQNLKQNYVAKKQFGSKSLYGEQIGQKIENNKFDNKSDQNYLMEENKTLQCEKNQKSQRSIKNAAKQQENIDKKNDQIINSQQKKQSNKINSVKGSQNKSVKMSEKVSSKGNVQKVNKSIQYSQMEYDAKKSEIKYKPSEQSSEVKNQSSLLESSIVKRSSNKDSESGFISERDYNMRKKKIEQVQEVSISEKKQKVFKIHSKGTSRQKSSHKSKTNRSQQSKSIAKNEDFYREEQSVSKEQIMKLHQQIQLLQQKLKRVEDKQQQIEKNQGTLSKIPIESQQYLQMQSPSLNYAEMTQKLKLQPKLSIESQIIKIDSSEQEKKIKQKQKEGKEKQKLNGQIQRLKKIIRDMQMQKIKSIDVEQDLTLISRVQEKIGRSGVHENSSRQMQDSSASFEPAKTQKREWGSQIRSRINQDIGKIIKNSPQKTHSIPQRSSSKNIQAECSEQLQLEVRTNNIEQSNFQTTRRIFPGIQRVYNENRDQQIVKKIDEKSKDFHSFVESSRVIAEDASHPRFQQMQQQTSLIETFNQSKDIKTKTNYSRMVQDMKKVNPEEEEHIPQIQLRDIKIPNLPSPPSSLMTQQQLLSLAKDTYAVFNVDFESEQKQLCVKKYKNCVLFSIGNATTECILWHFSGKFYMGGWKINDGQGEKNGQGLEIVPNKHIYQGQFLNAKKSGNGIMKQANGNIYDGQWVQGIKNGRGTYFDAATNVIYSGDWREGKKDGQGLLKISEKEYYFGTFKKSIKEGYGIEHFINADKYRGQYRSGKFQGKGKYTWANGSSYEGQFVEGIRHGQGSWKSSKNSGDIYIGSYEHDKKNGYGRYVWSNGCVFEGGFANDTKHGKGRLIYQDGKQIKGQWQFGSLVSTENDNKKVVDHEDQPLRKSMKISSFGQSAYRKL